MLQYKIVRVKQEAHRLRG